MATHNVAAGDIAAHNFTLTANTVETVAFGDNTFGTVEIISDGAAAVYYTLDGTAPTVGGSNTRVLPSGVISVDTRDVRSPVDVVKLISTGTPTISVQRGN